MATFSIPDVTRAHNDYGGRDLQANNITLVNGNVDPVGALGLGLGLGLGAVHFLFQL